MSLLPAHDAAAVLSHPLRAVILERLYDREASPVELARELGESLPNVAYHVHKLVELGAIAEVRRRQVRGGTQHFYTATVRITLKQEPL